MTTIMTQAERHEACARIRAELGIDRMGSGPDAPPLPPPSRDETVTAGAALPVEAEIHGAQLLEYEVWSRPGLDLRTRSFLTLAALTALGHVRQLRRHVNSALNLGITPDEIHELFLHVGNYAGLPTWENAMPVAREVFVLRGILPAGDGVTVDPKPAMTREERRAARDRIVAALNLGRVGRGADAPVLKGLPGGLTNWSMGEGTPLPKDIVDLAADHGFGEIWGRPGLEIRIRSLITLAVLQVLYETNEMQIHMNNALNIGISAEELCEALFHVGLYGGYSGWHSAALIADDVFAQHATAQEPEAGT
ncbi:carboxymuconolactone decarboxylase family protein [Streptomyces sp. NPDC002680]|uniref:carboxymuconolactone decarboxylase family protein n=1 Tax=Streptomyces sp. NPDC002680 TaxID=3364659 RepID=UPI0036AE0F71